MTGRQPFGPPDASGINFSELESTYVSVNGSETEDIYNSVDPGVRVIFGKRGSGKTLYLKTMRDKLLSQNSNNVKQATYLTEIDSSPPDSTLIVRVASWIDCKKDDPDETWRTIWKTVILRTVISEVLFNKALKEYTSEKLKDELKNEFKKIIPRKQSSLPILTHLKSILKQFNSLRDLKNHLHLDDWDALEQELSEILLKLPPLYYFIDQIDDDFRNAPKQWLSCQYGLFAAIFRLVRQHSYGRRLHVVACLREFVYAYILDSQSVSKYLSEPKVKILRWDHEMTLRFLKRKISSLDKQYLINPKKQGVCTNYFGYKLITSKNGYEDEKVLEYIIRHTMGMPRDVINIGNLFYEERGRHKDIYKNQIPLRIAVRQAAKKIAKEQLSLATIMLISRWIYDGAVSDGTYVFLTDENTRNQREQQLKNLILDIGSDRFTRIKMQNRLKQIKKFGFEQGDDVFNILFLSGLLGYEDKDANGQNIQIFFSGSRDSQYSLPMEKNNYFFHTSLTDLLNVKPKGKPIYAQY